MVALNKSNPSAIAEIILGAIFLPMMITVVGARLWAAKLLSRNLRVDDYLVVIALIFGIIFHVAAWVGFSNGVGYHVDQLSLEDIANVLKTFLVGAPTWVTSTVAAKVSILALYNHIFVSKLYRWLSYATMALFGSAWICFTALFLGGCEPFAFNWDKSIEGGHCLGYKTEMVAGIPVLIFLDIALVILPMPQIWKLRMTRAQKLILMGVFGLAIILVGINIWRLYLTATLQENDFTHNLVPQDIACTLEVFASIVIACLPTVTSIPSALRSKAHRLVGKPSVTCSSEEHLSPPNPGIGKDYDSSIASRLTRPSDTCLDDDVPTFRDFLERKDRKIFFQDRMMGTPVNLGRVEPQATASEHAKGELTKVHVQSSEEA